jgi:hypothetical protein
MTTACKDLKAPYNKRLTLDEYKAEVERRRQIGLTIDPATAETTFWWADVFDPYHILDEQYHGGCVGRERFARNPGGEWVDINDLPEPTRKALWERDGRKLVYDVINRPPAVKVNEGSRVPEQEGQ